MPVDAFHYGGREEAYSPRHRGCALVFMQPETYQPRLVQNAYD